MDGDPGRNADEVGDTIDTIYIIESAKLRNPTLTTLKMLNRAKVVVTDPRGNYDEFNRIIKFELNKEANQKLNKNTICQRFLIMSSQEEFEKLQRVSKCGSLEDEYDKDLTVLKAVY